MGQLLEFNTGNEDLLKGGVFSEIRDKKMGHGS